MTFGEFIGVKCGDIDIETGERMTHRAIYRRAIERFGGLEKVKPFIPFGLNEIRKAIPGDEYLNNLSARKWDFASGFNSRHSDKCGEIVTPNGCGLWNLYRKHGITSASNSQGVCLLKEAAKEWAEEEFAK